MGLPNLLQYAQDGNHPILHLVDHNNVLVLIVLLLECVFVF